MPVLVRSHFQSPSHLQLRAVARSQVVDLLHCHTCPGSTACSHDWILAPIRRLPTEILVTIFSIHSAADAHTFHCSSHLFWTELDRLANVPLLALSQVCSRWHSIVMNTPTLWSRFQLNGVLWITRYRRRKTMPLLMSALERGRNTLISIAMSDDGDLPYTWPTSHDHDHGISPLAEVFELLAQHSHRWEVATFSCYLVLEAGLNLAVLNGKLPCLKGLEITAPRTVRDVDLQPLVGAPHLCTLTASVELLERFGKTIPFKQLRKLVCLTRVPWHLARAISVAPRLPTGSYFRLEFYVDSDRRVLTLRIPPTTASISALSLLLMDQYHRPHSAKVLGNVFASLTLPCLQQLEVSCTEYPRLLLDWPHACFLERCARSSFHRCLKTLMIGHVIITERKLVQVLSALESLESLSIADQYRRLAESESDGTLVTDSLLRALTLSSTPGPKGRLVPRLRHMSCSTFLHFSAAILADFLASRLDQQAPSPFNFEVRPDANSLRSQNNVAPVRRMLRQLSADNKRFVYLWADVLFDRM
ncbi:hypothetical protein GGX14DRAFT_150507, partial [Mycena pura]